MPISINGSGFNAGGGTGLNGASSIQKNYERLSSGRRLNRSADDPSGVAISESLEALTRSLSAAQRNTTSGVSLASVREGALSSVTDLTTRMRELAVQAADGGLSSTDRGYIDTEFQQLKEEVGRVSGSVEFNGQKVLSGAAGEVNIQVGTGSGAGDQIALKTGGIDTASLGLDGLSLAGGNGASALAALDQLDGAQAAVNMARADNGASLNRLVESQQSSLDRRTSLVAANSTIRDTDFAEETSSLARNQILQAARISVLAAANQGAALALNLLNR